MAIPSSSHTGSSVYGMIAPISGQSAGLVRAQMTHGVRELVLCKGADGKIGLRCQVFMLNIGEFEYLLHLINYV